MLNLNWNKDQNGQTKQNQTLPWLIKALEEPGKNENGTYSSLYTLF